MFTANNDYEEAIKGSRIYAYEHRKDKKRVLLGKLLSLTTIAVMFSVGFNYYQVHSLQEFKHEVEDLLISSQVLAQNAVNNSKLTQQVLEISRKENKEEKVFEQNSEDVSMSEIAEKDDYLIALDNMEIDVLDDTEPKSTSDFLTPKVTEDAKFNQMSLSVAMSDLVDEAIADNSSYTKNLKKEIITESKSKSRIIIVKKGDTLESISKKFYGNPKKYKAIIASNSNLLNNANSIYEGQKITLP